MTRTGYGFGFELPIRTKTENNNDEHWRLRWKRAKQQRQTVHQYLTLLARQGYRIELPVTVTLIRVAPRVLDHVDNLSSSQKHTRDGIADFFQVDDRSPQYTWIYEQVKGKPKYYGIRIILAPQEGLPL